VEICLSIAPFDNMLLFVSFRTYQYTHKQSSEDLRTPMSMIFIDTYSKRSE
jgi:hypothetical protein